MDELDETNQRLPEPPWDGFCVPAPFDLPYEGVSTPVVPRQGGIRLPIPMVDG